MPHGRVRTCRSPALVQGPALPAALAEVGIAVPDQLGRKARLDCIRNYRSLPTDAIYIGRGHQALGLGRSPFANPFRVGPDGDRITVVAKFRAWFTTQQALMRKVRDLAGHLLL